MHIDKNTNRNSDEFIESNLDDSNFMEDMLQAEEDALCFGFEETLIIDFDDSDESISED